MGHILFFLLDIDAPPPAELSNNSSPSQHLLLFFRFLYSFIFGGAGSSVQLRGAEATLYHGQSSSSRCSGLVAPGHVGSSQTRDRTCVSCVGRLTHNHWTTREAPRQHLGFNLLRDSKENLRVKQY